MSLSDIVDSKWMAVIFLIISMAMLALFIVNSIYFSDINSSSCGIKRNTARTLMWINIILSILSGLVMLYYMWKVFLKRKELKSSITRKVDQLESGFGGARSGFREGYQARRNPESVMEEIRSTVESRPRPRRVVESSVNSFRTPRRTSNFRRSRTPRRTG